MTTELQFKPNIMKKLIIFLVAINIQFTIINPEYSGLKAQDLFSKVQKKKLKEANYYFDFGDYLNDQKIYDELYKLDSLFQ